VRPSLLTVVYVVIGLIVAYANDYLDNLGTFARILTAILAVLMWPLILIGFDVRVVR
jgi:hypothetical protein